MNPLGPSPDDIREQMDYILDHYLNEKIENVQKTDYHQTQQPDDYYGF
jgi:hypothetical protein